MDARGGGGGGVRGICLTPSPPSPRATNGLLLPRFPIWFDVDGRCVQVQNANEVDLFGVRTVFRGAEDKRDTFVSTCTLVTPPPPFLFLFSLVTVCSFTLPAKAVAVGTA